MFLARFVVFLAGFIIKISLGNVMQLSHIVLEAYG
jgi:hypothetical protein